MGGSRQTHKGEGSVQLSDEASAWHAHASALDPQYNRRKLRKEKD